MGAQTLKRRAGEEIERASQTRGERQEHMENDKTINYGRSALPGLLPSFNVSTRQQLPIGLNDKCCPVWTSEMVF